LEAIETKHLAMRIKIVSQAIGVEDYAISSFDGCLNTRVTAHCVFKQAQNHMRRFEQPWRLSLADDDCRRMTRPGKLHVATSTMEAHGCYGKVET
jgi:hypothetical protein